ncbi:MAG: signal peptidase I [Eubacterium sp.]|nr:signal peptidase I [Eubacterium sp.]
MVCKKCGSENVVNEGERFVCKDCGAVAVDPSNKKELKKIKKEKKQKEEENKSFLRETVDFCLPIVIALIVAMLLKTFVFANAVVPTGSMLNTIQEQDRLIASRIEYNFHDPERFDIIIFKFPDDVAAHEQDPSHKVDYFVKRIIGLPGETVTIVNGVVYVEDKNGNTTQLRDDFVTACKPTGNYGPYKVPEDSYFVLGDNREASADSRFWETTNYVKRDLIIGKVKFRYMPFNTAGKLE